ncbi:MAG TPA: zinc ribbon domain-containing protein [Anaerolineae bacterium]|nr:zinc ribbon domain-containing protein [Anaerolineae bacterium]
MPVYEFICEDCGKLVRVRLSFAEYDTATPACRYCESLALRRRIGRVAVARSEDSRLAGAAEGELFAGLDEDDPRSLGKFMRKMSNELGEDLGDEFGEVVDRLERGQAPDEIEKSMPDLAPPTGGDGHVHDHGHSHD